MASREIIFDIVFKGNANAIGNANEKIEQMKEKAKGAGKNLDELANKMGAVGKKMTLGLTTPIVAFGGASFKMAADLEDAMGASEQIFKSASGSMDKWASSLPSYYGVAKGEAVEYTNVMGAMLKNIGGLTENEAAGQSQKLLELAADLSAMYGGTTQEAVHALTGSLKGNNTMLDNYGMGVNEATIKAKALAMGLSDGTGELTLQAKQAATLELIMEQTGDAQGQAAREAEGASGSMKAFTTEIKNLSTNVGGVLLPIITPMIGSLAGIAKKFGEMPEPMQKVIIGVAAVVAGIGPLLMIAPKVLAGFRLMTQGFGLLKTGVGMLSKSFALLTSPMGLVVLGIIAVVAVGVLLYKNWDLIKEKASALGASIVATFNAMVAWFGGLPARMGAAGRNMMTALGSGISSLMGAVVGKAKLIGTAIVNAFRALPARMVSIGKNIIQGIIGGITSKARELTNKVQAIANGIKDKFKNALGIHSPSLVFQGYGKNIGEGLNIGMDNESKNILSKSRQIANVATEGFTPTKTSTSSTINNSNSVGDFNPVININVTGADNPRQVARSFEQEFNVLMARYNKKLKMRNSYA